MQDPLNHNELDIMTNNHVRWRGDRDLQNFKILLFLGVHSDGESLLEVSEEVIHVLDSHRQADEVITDSELLAFLDGNRSVRHHSRALSE